MFNTTGNPKQRKEKKKLFFFTFYIFIYTPLLGCELTREELWPSSPGMLLVPRSWVPASLPLASQPQFYPLGVSGSGTLWPLRSGAPPGGGGCSAGPVLERLAGSPPTPATGTGGRSPGCPRTKAGSRPGQPRPRLCEKRGDSPGASVMGCLGTPVHSWRIASGHGPPPRWRTVSGSLHLFHSCRLRPTTHRCEAYPRVCGPDFCLFLHLCPHHAPQPDHQRVYPGSLLHVNMGKLSLCASVP